LKRADDMQINASIQIELNSKNKKRKYNKKGGKKEIAEKLAKQKSHQD